MVCRRPIDARHWSIHEQRLYLAVVMFAEAASVFVCRTARIGRAARCNAHLQHEDATLDANRNYYDVTQARAHKVDSDSQAQALSRPFPGGRVSVPASGSGIFPQRRQLPAPGDRMAPGLRWRRRRSASGHVAGTRYRLESTRTTWTSACATETHNCVTGPPRAWRSVRGRRGARTLGATGS